MTSNAYSNQSPRASFHADGFVCEPGVLPGQQVHDLQAVAESGIADVAKTTRLSLEKVESLISAWGSNSSFVKAMVSAAMPHLRTVANSVAEVRPEPVDATVFIKSAKASSATHAHQDIAYRWNREPGLRYGLTTWLALDDVGDEKGGVLSFLPGSHCGKISVRQDFLAHDFCDYAASDEWQQYAIPVPAAAGDVVVFDAQTWHAAGAFMGQGDRRALAVRWSYADQHETRLEIPAPSVDTKCFGIDTSGEMLVAAFIRAYPSLPAFNQATPLAEKIEFLLGWCRSNKKAMPTLVQKTLEDLATALTLESAHGARTNPELWLNVRDRVIPALSTRFWKGGKPHG